MDFPFDVQVTDPVNTILSWGSIPAVLTYDVIHGDLNGLFLDAVTAHLGSVTCIENDSVDTTTGAGAEPASPDTAIPVPGEGFFYVVRFHDGIADSTYGFTRGCIQERIVDSGDCP